MNVVKINLRHVASVLVRYAVYIMVWCPSICHKPVFYWNDCMDWTGFWTEATLGLSYVVI